MALIAGVSFGFHDSATAVVDGGRVIAAAQEERFTRRCYDASFPRRATEFCLRQSGVTTADLEFVGYYEKPLTKFERILRSHVQTAPWGFRSFRTAIPRWVSGAGDAPGKLRVRHVLKQHFPGYRRRFIFADHHQSHAAGAFFSSPFDSAAILTLDGVGAWRTASTGIGRGTRLTTLTSLSFPHSLGLLYSAFTQHCGFRVDSGEYKLMGLAAYGEPRYVDRIVENLVDLRVDGSFRLDMRYFGFVGGTRMTNRRFERLFGSPGRRPEAPIRDHDRDMAASIQRVTEQILLRMGTEIHCRTGESKLCLAGGVGLNAVAVGRLIREGPFSDVWVQPAAGDAGGAIGVAQLIEHHILDRPRTPGRPEVYLGPEFTAAEIDETLVRVGAIVEPTSDRSDLVRRTAQLLSHGQVVGWMQGPMEFGPRALGNRSILADPRGPAMKAKLNVTVKRRESFRPFAPVVMRERVGEVFDVPHEADYPVMTAVARVRPAWRERLPAVTHVDATARLQTVDATSNPSLYALIDAFDRITKCPILVNTSFNVRDEPIVCTPDDAWRCFMDSGMDAVVIGDRLCLKSAQSVAPESSV